MQSARIVTTGFVLIICLALTSLTCLGQAPAKTPELIFTKPLEREITRGQTHEYQVTLKDGEFMQVRVEQKGIDIVLSIFSATGKRLAEMDSPTGQFGIETLSWVSTRKEAVIVGLKSSKTNMSFFERSCDRQVTSTETTLVHTASL